MMMKITKMMMVAMLTTVCCTQLAAQGVTPTTPQLLSDNSVKFTMRAPEAQKVQVDLGGTKYDMTKGEGGVWTVAPETVAAINTIIIFFMFFSFLLGIYIFERAKIATKGYPCLLLVMRLFSVIE